MSDVHKAGDAMRAALRDLEDSIKGLCPAGSKHQPIQHRDRRPPWCESCRRTALGTDIDRVEDDEW